MSFGDLKVQDLIYEDSSNNEITVVIADLATKANPVFSGTVIVPTATAGDNSTKAASTAFVVASFAPKNAPAFTGSATGVNLTLSGDLTVNGTTTTINTTTLQVEDKNIEIGKVSSPSDTTANGGGWTLLGSTNKTFNWLNATDSWTSSEHIEIASGKNLKVDGTTFFVDGTNNRVGIGTTSPDEPLTISRATTGNGLKVVSTNNNTRAQIQLSGKDSSGNLVTLKMGGDGDTGGNIFTLTNHKLGFSTNNAAPQLILDTYGRLLLGTTTAGGGSADDLTIATTGQTGITIRSGASAGGQIYFADGTSGDDRERGIISYQHGGNYMRFYTNASERLRITEDGALGIAGGNYGTSGQVLTSGGSGAAPSWSNPAAGGNTFTAVADGAIATNKCVKIKTNGKIEEITQVITGGNPADDNANEIACGTADAGNNSWFIYDPAQTKLVSFYTATYGDNNLRYSVMARTEYNGKFFSGPISGSADLGVESTARVNGAYEWGSVCYDTNNNKYIIGFRCRNDNLLYVGAGTYNTSNNSITWPSGKSNWTQPNGTNNAGRIPTLYFDDTTNRIVCLLRDDSNSNYPYVVIGTYNSSSGSIDWGTKQLLSSTGISDNNTVICKGGSGTGDVFIGYKVSGPDLRGNLITVSNSSNTCTIQTAVTIQAYAEAFRADYSAEDQNIILAYADTNDSHKGKLIRLTKNSGGTGFDKSSTLTFCVNNQPSRWDVHYFSTAKKIYVFYRKSSSDRKSYGFVITNTSGAPTKGSEAGSVGNNADVWMGHCAHTNKGDVLDRIFQAYTDNGSGRCEVEGWTSLSSTSTQTTSTKHQYVGYPDQAYSDGQTATVKTYGNIKSGLSGLTTGSKYFVNGNGTLSTGDQGLGHAGLALAADKLLIKEPEI